MGCNRKICNDKFPKSLDINKEEITDKKIRAETFNKFFNKVQGIVF